MKSPGSESANRTLADSLPGDFTPWPFHSLELSLCGSFAPDIGGGRCVEMGGAKSGGPFCSWQRKFQGARGPGSESSRERIGQGPIGRFAPGSELARERKGCESAPTAVLYFLDSIITLSLSFRSPN